MELNQQANKFLLEIAKWSTFLAIVGFITIALMVILSFSIGTILSQIPENNMGVSPQFFSFFYLIFAGIYFIPVYYLFQFGSKTKKALINNDADLLAFGLKKLKSHYKFIGLITIIMISLNILFLIFGTLAATLILIKLQK